MATELGDRRITGYPDDAPREKKELELKTYEYEFPFNYPNVILGGWGETRNRAVSDQDLGRLGGDFRAAFGLDHHRGG